MKKFSPGTEKLEKCINWLEHWQHWNYQETLLTSAEPSPPLDQLSSDAPIKMPAEETLFLVHQISLCLFLGMLSSLCPSTYYLGTGKWVLIKKIRNILWTAPSKLTGSALHHPLCLISEATNVAWICTEELQSWAHSGSAHGPWTQHLPSLKWFKPRLNFKPSFIMAKWTKSKKCWKQNALCPVLKELFLSQ